jgi:hypothetical protein
MTFTDWSERRPASYDFAVSYSSRDAATVRPVVDALVLRGYRVFEYVAAISSAWGRELTSHLDSVFDGSAAAYVVFLSANYVRGHWTNYEWAKIRTSTPRGAGRDVAVVRIDDSIVPSDQRCCLLVEDAAAGIDTARVVGLLTRHLLDLEGVTIGQEGNAPPIELIAISLRAIDGDACRASIAATGGVGPSLSVRLPSDLHELYCKLRQGLASDWPSRGDPAAAEDLLRAVETTHVPRIATGLGLLASCARAGAWSHEDLAIGAEAYFLAECFRVVRALAAFAHVFDDTFRRSREYFRLGAESGPPRMIEALAWVTQDQEESITFWSDADLYDSRSQADPLRHYVFVPSTMYLPRDLNCSPPEFMRFIVPQLIDWSLDHGDTSLLECLLLDPQRVHLVRREEWLIDVARYKCVETDRPSAAIDHARSTTERRLRTLIRSGRLSDGLENVALEDRLAFHLRRMPCSKAPDR